MSFRRISGLNPAAEFLLSMKFEVETIEGASKYITGQQLVDAILGSPFSVVGSITKVIGVQVDFTGFYHEVNITNTSATLGLQMAALPSLELDIVNSPLLGIEQAVALDAGTANAISSHVLGILVSALITTVSDDPNASFSLGLNMSALIELTRTVAASPSLGVQMAASLTRESDLAASIALGIAMTAVLTREADIAASIALGVSMAAAVTTLAGSITFTFITSTTVSNAGSSNTIVIPATAAVGDLAFLFDAAEDGGASTPVNVVPTGWSGTTNSLQPLRVTSSRKILVGGDPGATITGMSGGASNLKTMLIIRPSSAIGTTHFFQDLNGQVTAATPTTQNVTAGTAPYVAPVIVLAHWATATTDGAITGDTITAADATVSNGTHQKVAYKLYNSAPANESIAMGDAGAHNALQSYGHYFT